MKKVIAIMLSLILVFSFSACSKNKNDDNNTEEITTVSNIKINNIFYSNNDNDDTSSIYIEYTVSASQTEDISYGDSAKIKTNYGEQGSSLYTWDKYKDLVERAGFPVLINYQTLYAGSEKTLGYIAHFTINKRCISNDETMTLIVPNDKSNDSIDFCISKSNAKSFTNDQELVTLFYDTYNIE